MLQSISGPPSCLSRVCPIIQANAESSLYSKTLARLKKSRWSLARSASSRWEARDQANAAIQRLNGSKCQGEEIGRGEYAERYLHFRLRTYDDEGRPWDSKREIDRHRLSE